MTFEVINLRTGKAHGSFETLEEAKGCVQFDRLTAWQIWKHDSGLVCERDPGQGHYAERSGTGRIEYELPKLHKRS